MAARRAFALVALAPACALAADWMQFGYDAQHSGENPDERIITRDNVAQLTRLHEVTLDSEVTASPVYLAHVPTPGGLRNLAFTVSRTGSLSAIDVVSGAIVWSRVQPWPDDSFMRIDSSPAIDPGRQYVYAYRLDGNVHKYSVADGTEIVGGGWPELVTLKPRYEHVASALAIATAANGRTFLYAVTDGYYGDFGDYQGHLVAIDLSSGEQKVFNSLCSDLAIHFVDQGVPGVDDCESVMSGIWGRPGAVYDARIDRVFVATSNGWFDANMSGHDWGDSILALAPDGSGLGAGFPLDSFSPTTYDELRHSDLDFGAASPVIVPTPATSRYPHLGAHMGKDGQLHLLDLDDMSGTGAPGMIGGDLQTFGLTDKPPTNPLPQPATWVDPADGATWLFVPTVWDGLKALKLRVDATGMPSFRVEWTSGNQTIATPVIANGILFWGSGAYDPASGERIASTAPNCCYWGGPIVVDGRVIATGYSLVVYGIDVIFASSFERAD